jgi:hypothetical protein
MRISVKRTGGYSGQEEAPATLDTARLPADVAQGLQALVQKSAFFEQQAEATGSTVGADLYRYHVTVRDGSREHSVTFADDGRSPEAEPLRQLVQEVMRRR